MPFAFLASGRIKRLKLRNLTKQPFRRHEGAYRHALLRRRAIRERIAKRSIPQRDIERHSQEPAIEHTGPKSRPKLEKSIRELVESFTGNADIEHEAIEKLSEAAEAMIIHWFERLGWLATHDKRVTVMRKDLKFGA